MKPHSDPTPSEPSAASRRRIPKWAVIVVVTLAVLTAAGSARHVYLSWKERRLIRAARVYLNNDKPAELRLALDSALALNPNNVEAARLSAQALLKTGSAKALPWLRRTVELAPESIDDQIALAEGALRFGQMEEAARVVKEIEPKARDRADFLDLAGRVTQQNSGPAGKAEAYFAEAVRLDPQNPKYRLHLAITRLASADAAVREEARGEVGRLSSESSARVTALRALVIDAVKFMRTDQAMELARELNGLHDRAFADQLMYLEVLRLAGSADFQTELAQVQKDAAQNPGNILPLLAWMNGNNLSLLARDWALRLPSELTAPVEIRMEMARSFAAFGDWKKLRYFLANEQWGDSDYMRRAYLSRCSRELEASETPSKVAWSEAINATGNRGDALLALARMALQWRWDSEAADALWQAVSKSNRSNEALNALVSFYFSRQQTAGLYRVYSLLMDRNPADANIRNNYVIFSLLLDKDKSHVLTIARELHEKDLASPVFASTYAFALYCCDQNPKAMEVMSALKPEELKDPSIAAYYSAILSAAGRDDEARKYRDLAKGANLLPEEARRLKLPPPEPAAPAPQPILPDPIPPFYTPGAQPEPSAAPAASEPAPTPAPTEPAPAPEPASTPAQP